MIRSITPWRTAVDRGIGFMWFGTQYGLNRYDGHKFRVFVHDPQRPNSLGGTWIYALFKDQSGIWLITWRHKADGSGDFD